jgi:outer membrane protein, multidrug efflux system
MLKFNPVALALFVAGLLTACGNLPVAPAYVRPALELPADAKGATGSAVDFLSWWKTFQDPVLDALLQEAASQSQDLALASARIEEARATLSLNQSNLYPTVDLNAATSRRRSSENSAGANPSANSFSSDVQVGLTASYEIDFWGKYARADDATRARLLSQTAARGTVLTSLYANVAQSYFALRALDAQLVLAEQTLATRAENLRLQKRRFEGGVIGELDLRQAEAEAAAVEATLQTTRQGRRNAESALVLLLGRQPVAIAKPAVARGAAIGALFAAQAVPQNLPSDLLNRRPDLISAEQSLIAANADIAQARTAYFPKISLTATLGQQSKDLSNLLDPASLFWNLLGNLTQPIFRAGSIDAVVAAANARQKQAVAQYTLAVQSAFRDVNDALNNAQDGQQLVNTVARRIEALRNTLRLADLRYKSGYSNYLEVLSAQRDLAQAEIALIDAKRTQLGATVSLYKALGGGWDAATTAGQMTSRRTAALP